MNETQLAAARGPRSPPRAVLPGTDDHDVALRPLDAPRPDPTEVHRQALVCKGRGGGVYGSLEETLDRSGDSRLRGLLGPPFAELTDAITELRAAVPAPAD